MVRVVRHAFDRFASRASAFAGSAWMFAAALAAIGLWAASGVFFGFSDTWQLVINTATTIVTFLMVFLIHHAQNKDSRAVQLKLDELIAATKGASNRLIDVETLTDDELEELHKRFQSLGHELGRLKAGEAGSIEDVLEEIQDIRDYTREKARKRRPV